MHEGGFARTVVTDKPQAFASGDVQVHTGQGTDGAERFFDAVQSDRVG